MPLFFTERRCLSILCNPLFFFLYIPDWKGSRIFGWATFSFPPPLCFLLTADKINTLTSPQAPLRFLFLLCLRNPERDKRWAGLLDCKDTVTVEGNPSDRSHPLHDLSFVKNNEKGEKVLNLQSSSVCFAMLFECNYVITPLLPLCTFM